MRLAVGLAAALAVLAHAPAAPAVTVYGLEGTASPALTSFDSASPGTVTPVAAISGLDAGYALVSIDFRPSDGSLWGLARMSSDDTKKLYRIDPASGAATFVANVTMAGNPTFFGMDWAPTANTLRIVTNNDLNVRYIPTSGTSVTDVALTASDNAIAVGLAYDNDVPGASSTTAWVLDQSPSGTRLDRLGGPGGVPSANGGLLTPIGPLGQDIDASQGFRAGFDVAPDGTALASYPSGMAMNVYGVDLSNGSATLVGAYGGAPLLIDIAVAPVSNAFSVEQAAATVPESAGAVTLNVLRSNGLGAASVGFATADGTAGAADYTPASGTLEFGPGELSKSLTVPLLDDAADEPDESFQVALQSPSGGLASIGAQGAATVTIADDDPAPDTVAPQIGRCWKRKQDIAKRGAVRVCARPSEAGTLAARGSLKVRGTRKRFRLRSAQRALTGAGKVTLKLELRKKALRALRRARHGRARITLTATDPSGNRGSVTLRVKQRRRR